MLFNYNQSGKGMRSVITADLRLMARRGQKNTCIGIGMDPTA